MKVVHVSSPLERVMKTSKIERDLQWYDSKHKVMREFKGGKLEFEYQIDKTLNPPERRMLPKVADVNVQIPSYKTDLEKARKWFFRYQNYNNSTAEIIEIDNKGITIVVPDGELDDLLYDLERNGLRSEIL